MAVRLKVAGINSNKFNIASNYETMLNYIEKCQGEIVYVLATYTAMIDFRKYLHSKGLIEKLW